MKIDRVLFKEHHLSDNLPKWICPSCDHGILTTTKDSIRIIESEESKKDHHHPNHEPQWNRGIFTGKLICPHDKCKESHFFSGSTMVDFIDYEMDDDGEYHAQYGWYLKPSYFSKPLKLFRIQDHYPDAIQKSLEESFGLIWTDSAACANKIRSVVEKILDDRKIQKYEIKKSKRKPIFLHTRINDFRTKNPDAAQFFEAVKWIGNVGSHGDDDKLKREDLIIAFEMLEHALDIIYNKHSKDLKRLATKIIKRKGPVKTTKKVKFGIK